MRGTGICEHDYELGLELGLFRALVMHFVFTAASFVAAFARNISEYAAHLIYAVQRTNGKSVDGKSMILPNQPNVSWKNFAWRAINLNFTLIPNVVIRKRAFELTHPANENTVINSILFRKIPHGQRRAELYQSCYRYPESVREDLQYSFIITCSTTQDISYHEFTGRHHPAPDPQFQSVRWLFA